MIINNTNIFIFYLDFLESKADILKNLSGKKVHIPKKANIESPSEISENESTSQLRKRKLVKDDQLETKKKKLVEQPVQVNVMFFITLYYISQRTLMLETKFKNCSLDINDPKN